jgi:hypothetical protein
MQHSIRRGLKFVSSWISDELRDTWREIFSGDPYQRKTSEPRDLTIDDRLAWNTAMEDRTSLRTKEDIRKVMSNRNPVRFWQLQRDFKWLQRQMKKAGLNPEDARYIL